MDVRQEIADLFKLEKIYDYIAKIESSKQISSGIDYMQILLN